MASLGEIETLLEKTLEKTFEKNFADYTKKTLGLQEGETLADYTKKTLGLHEGETLVDKTNQIVRQAFEDKLNIQEGDSVDLPKLERKVGSLWAANPIAVLQHLHQNVVGRGSKIEEYEAVANGGLSTWTYIKHENRKMAVGAAHCALPFKLLPGRDKRCEGFEFVEIPEELCGRVTRVGIHQGYHSTRNEDCDLAVVELESFPDRIDPLIVPEWVAFDSVRPPSWQCKVGGLNLTGSVHGHSCVVGAGPVFKFVEESGEAGNSGTLMYIVSPHDGENTEIIGVYLGTARVKMGQRWPHHGEADLKAQGRILRLPQLTDSVFHWSEVQEPLQPGNTFQLRGIDSHTHMTIETGSRPSYFSKKPDNTTMFGVFIRKPQS